MAPGWPLTHSEKNVCVRCVYCVTQPHAHLHALSCAHQGVMTAPNLINERNSAFDFTGDAPEEAAHTAAQAAGDINDNMRWWDQALQEDACDTPETDRRTLQAERHRLHQEITAAQQATAAAAASHAKEVETMKAVHADQKRQMRMQQMRMQQMQQQQMQQQMQMQMQKMQQMMMQQMQHMRQMRQMQTQQEVQMQM